MNDLYLLPLVLVLFLIVIIFRPREGQEATDEEKAKKAQDLAKAEKELARIYWHISEIDRIAALKTKAIKSGDMETYKALCTEKDNLDRLYKFEFPNA
jgi:flagellar biosynthesis/type III secretory pathway M-ring protein FliF/YscJ